MSAPAVDVHVSSTPVIVTRPDPLSRRVNSGTSESRVWVTLASGGHGLGPTVRIIFTLNFIYFYLGTLYLNIILLCTQLMNKIRCL